MKIIAISNPLTASHPFIIKMYKYNYKTNKAIIIQDLLPKSHYGSENNSTPFK